MNLVPFSYQSTDQVDPFAEIDQLSDSASVGNRISMQRWVAIFLLFDLVSMAGLGFLVGMLGTLFGLRPPTVIDDEALTIGIALFIFVLMARCMDAYTSRCILDLRYSVGRIVAAVFVTFLALLAPAAAAKTSQIYSQSCFLFWAALTFTLITAFRVAARAHIRKALDNKDAFVFRALSAGIFSDPLSAEEISRLTNNQVKTVVSMRLKDFEALKRLSNCIVREDIDRIYVTTSWIDVPIALRHLQVLRKFSVQIFVIPGNEWIRSSQSSKGTLEDLLILKVLDKPISDWGLWLKTMIDVVIATFAIAFTFPIIMCVAVAIKLDSRGPIIFRQKRIGFNGSIFEVWKFRSMYAEQTDLNAAVQTSKGDPRVTRVGRFLRRSSIDELPQFFNVLQGSMSVVGPRPHALGTRADGHLLEDIVDGYADRHRIKPGLTGWAQINGLRGEIDSVEKLKQRVEHDIEYIEKWSIWFDLKIIARTILLIVHDPSAY